MNDDGGTDRRITTDRFSPTTVLDDGEEEVIAATDDDEEEDYAESESDEAGSDEEDAAASDEEEDDDDAAGSDEESGYDSAVVDASTTFAGAGQEDDEPACQVCGEGLGAGSTRQLCGKTQCDTVQDTGDTETSSTLVATAEGVSSDLNAFFLALDASHAMRRAFAASLTKLGVGDLVSRRMLPSSLRSGYHVYDDETTILLYAEGWKPQRNGDDDDDGDGGDGDGGDERLDDREADPYGASTLTIGCPLITAVPKNNSVGVERQRHLLQAMRAPTAHILVVDTSFDADAVATNAVRVLFHAKPLAEGDVWHGVYDSVDALQREHRSYRLAHRKASTLEKARALVQTRCVLHAAEGTRAPPGTTVN